jgi:hypothetical protein
MRLLEMHPLRERLSIVISNPAGCRKMREWS